MDRRERFTDAIGQFRSAFEGMQSELWTALPGTVTAVDFDKMTCSVQPNIMSQFTDKNKVNTWVELPLLLDCPIIFPTGGGYTLTFPLVAGDEVLVLFASRCIDNWLVQEGDTGPSGHSRSQAEVRMHDLSDGFALVGLHNASRTVNEISTTDVQLRSDEGSSFFSVRENGDCLVQTDAKAVVFAESDVNVTSTDGDITATATTGSITATAGTDIQCTAGADIVLDATSAISIAGTVAISAAAPLITLTGVINIVGTLQLNGIPFGLSHEHSGVSTGTHNTGPVV